MYFIAHSIVPSAASAMSINWTLSYTGWAGEGASSQGYGAAGVVIQLPAGAKPHIIAEAIRDFVINDLLNYGIVASRDAVAIVGFSIS